MGEVSPVQHRPGLHAGGHTLGPPDVMFRGGSPPPRGPGISRTTQSPALTPSDTPVGPGPNHGTDQSSVGLAGTEDTDPPLAGRWARGLGAVGPSSSQWTVTLEGAGGPWTLQPGPRWGRPYGGVLFPPGSHQASVVVEPGLRPADAGWGACGLLTGSCDGSQG